MNLLTDVFGAFANKPPLGTPVNGHPLADGLWFSYLFNEYGGGGDGLSNIDDSSGMDSGVMTFTNSDPPAFPEAYPEWHPLGLSVGGGKGAVRNNKTVKSTFNPVRGSHTVRVVHIPNTFPAAFTALLDTGGTAGSGRILNIFLNASGNISYRGIGGSDGTPGANVSGQELGQINDLVWVRSFGDGTAGSTHTHYWYLNGKLFYTEVGLSTVLWPTDGYDMSFGQNPTGGGTVYNGTYVLVQAWDRALSADEVGLLYENPYIMYGDGPYTPYASTPPVDGEASVTFPSPAITVTPPEATAIAQVDGEASVTFPSPAITVTPPDAVASNVGIALVTFPSPAITVTPPEATASVADYVMLVERSIIEIVPQEVELKPSPGPDETTTIYVGRRQRGQKIGIFVNAINMTPAEAPIVDIWYQGITKIKTFQLPRASQASDLFGMMMYIDNDFEDGNYIATIRYSEDDWQAQHYRTFQVLGGDGTGHVLATHVMRRTLGTAVIKHTEDGTIRIGYNPRTSE